MRERTYDGMTRNLDAKTIRRIEQGQITQAERAESALLDGACKAHEEWMASNGLERATTPDGIGHTRF